MRENLKNRRIPSHQISENFGKSRNFVIFCIFIFSRKGHERSRIFTQYRSNFRRNESDVVGYIPRAQPPPPHRLHAIFKVSFL